MVDVDGQSALLDVGDNLAAVQPILQDALRRGEVREFARVVTPLSDVYREMTA